MGKLTTLSPRKATQRRANPHKYDKQYLESISRKSNSESTLALDKILSLDLSSLLCSASGASVGAIDNKIEQAMDLVKSHLMYAVREEVEVLKEQIKELLDRNTQLEKENNMLRQQQQTQQQQVAAQSTAPAVQQPQLQTTSQSNQTEPSAAVVQAVLSQQQHQS